MQIRTHWRVGTAILVALAIGGCAALEKEQAEETEQVLAAAGFRLKLADTPAKLAHLKTLTQRKIVPHQRAGVLRFTYADAAYCKCLYVGNERAFRGYHNLALRRQISQNMMTAASYNANAAMNWSLWGPWGAGGPWGPWGPYY